MNNLSKILVGGLLVLLVISVSVAFFEHHLRNNAEGLVNHSNKAVKQAATIINRYIDTNSRKHTVIASTENSLSPDWFKNGTAISGGLVDTVAQALNIAKKQLIEITQIVNITRGERLKAEKRLDSLQRITYYYKDKYLQLSYRPMQTSADSTGDGEFDFKYNDSINIVQYWKKRWFLGTKKGYIDIFSNDTRTTVNGVNRLVVEQKRPAFDAHIQIGGEYNFPLRQFYWGPSIQLNFKRLTAIGSYHYDFIAQTRQSGL